MRGRSVCQFCTTGQMKKDAKEWAQGLSGIQGLYLLFECQRVHARACGGTHQEATEGDTAPSSVDELTAPLN